MNRFDFSDKVVLVTGASRGIGRSIAQQFAAQGASVAVHYNHNLQAAEETASTLPGTSHFLVRANIANPDEVRDMVTAVVERMGSLDIVINNAGIYEDHPLAEVSYDEWQASWQRVLDVNLVGPANVCYCAAQQMIAQGGGRIVNVSSRGAFRGEPTSPAYGASKGGLNAMSQSLAKYLAPHNVFVGVVAPGWVETDMAAEHLASAEGEYIRNQSPLGRVARPDEVAYAVLFLASPGSEFMTGAVLDVNGASYLRT